MSGWLRVVAPRLLLFALSTGIGLVGLEAGLRLFTHFPIHLENANRQPHPALGFVMNSDGSEIDREGFRNSRDLAALAVVDVVAIGDSHTYGFNVASGDSWPAQLAERAKLSVYNYGMGGYGILQYRYLFSRALEKAPKAIIIAIYPANDLGDYCTLAVLDHWRPLLRERGFRPGICRGLAADLERDVDQPLSAWQRARLATAVGSALDYWVWRELGLRRNPNAFVSVTYGGHETFLPKALVLRHRRFTDLSLPPIAQAARASEVLLSEMIELASAHEIALAVLFIPSKENTLLESTDSSHPFFADLRQAVMQERAVASRLERYLSDRGVPTANAIDCLRKRLASQLYPSDAELHPVREGYACYAAAAMRLLENPAGS